MTHLKKKMETYIKKKYFKIFVGNFGLGFPVYQFLRNETCLRAEGSNCHHFFNIMCFYKGVIIRQSDVGLG
jgi:hypothetical protein